MKKVCSVVVDKMKRIKKYKKQILIVIGLFILLFIPTFLYINLTNPTSINKYIASVVNKGAAANIYFDDENFYNCVVDAYNSKNSTSLPYTTNLTDEQLKTIISLSCSSAKITSTKGLEKITSLTYLNLGSINLSSIDLSKNTSLRYLYLDSNSLSSIDLSANTSLTELNLAFNNLSNIDLSANTSLTELELTGNNLSSIDLSANTSLTELDLRLNNLSSIDLSKNTSLTDLELAFNNLSSIDVSENTSLTYLDMSYNNLSSIDLSKNTSLTTLDLTDNNYLNSIILNGKIDLDNIDVQYTNQSTINIGDNKIIKPISEYKYYLNNKVVIKENDQINDFITNLGLINLETKIYNGEDEIISGNIENGYILKIYDGENEIQNIPIHVFGASVFDDENFYNCVVDGYNEKNNTSLPYTTNLTDEQLKTITSLSCYSKKIISTKGLEKITSLTNLRLGDNILSSIDVSKNTLLTYLDLGSNSLSSIDLSKNTSLSYLNLASNNLSSIDLSKNPSLTYLGLGSNSLSSIDVSKNILLTDLDFRFNNLSSIDVSKNVSLTDLDLSYNNLGSIDVSKNTSLKSLDLRSNKLSSIDVSKNPSLTYLSLFDNDLSSIDVSKNTSLTTLNLSYNNLSSIDLSKNTSLTSLSLSSNPLKLQNMYLRKGNVIKDNNSDIIKMPKDSDKFYITYEIENSDIANYSEGEIKGLKTGITSLIATLNGVDMTVSGTINVYDITSNKYQLTDDYIYVKNDIENETILSNITIENGNDLTKSISDNKLYIKNGEEVIEEIPIVKISSSTYDLNKSYIYVGTNTLDTTKINVINGTVEVSNNVLNIKYNGEVLQSYKIASISSDTYNLSKDYIKLGTKETFNINNINTINCEKTYSNKVLSIKYGNDILKTYNIITRNTGDINNDNKITVLDVSMLYRHIKKRSVITDEETLSVSDVNKDGKITVLDVSMMYRYVKGKISEL